MTLWHLIRSEMKHRLLPFLLGCVSMAAAVGAVVLGVALLRGHDLRAELLVDQKELETRRAMARMEDDYRIIMKRMGYNVMVLHKDQDLAELHRLGHPTVTMPEAYADTLANSGIMSLNHLLPVLQHRFLWPEKGVEVMLTGVRGQLKLAARGIERSPIMAPIPQGRVALGKTLAQLVDAAAGEKVVIADEPFIVERVEPARGTWDDMALWVAIGKAQKWLGAEGSINGMLALECVCHSDSLGEIVEQVKAALPDTQVFEFSSIVRGRAEARKRAGETSRQAIEDEKVQRQRLRAERRRLISFVVPTVIVGAALIVMLLAFLNARDRRGEIGMLRAIGMRERQVVALMVIKSLLMGGAGGAAGLLLGVSIGAFSAGVFPLGPDSWRLAGGLYLIVFFLIGPCLGALAGLMPAVAAARRDPSDVLCKE